MGDPISFLVPCAVIGLASIPLMLKVVPPNKYYGFRTRVTLSDRRTWYRVNCFAGWALFAAVGTSMLIYIAVPSYASGRSLAGLLVFLVPLVAGVLASFVYLRRTTSALDNDA